MRGRRAVSYRLVPIALLAVAVTGSCTADLDEGVEGEGGSEGERVEEVGGNPDLLVAPTAPQNAEPPDDTAVSCPVGQTLVPGDDNRNIIKNRVDDACIVTLGGGDLVINRSRTAATILAGEGDDRVVTGHGDTLVAAGSGWDTVYAKGGDDEIYGQRDGDVLIGDGGNDLLDGGPGWDTLVGGRGHDTIQGGSGSDLIIAGADDDVIVAGAGDDIIIGDGLFFRSRGNDEIVPGPGRDKVSAGNGDDTVIVYDVCELEWGEVLSGGSGTDTLITPVELAAVQALGVQVTGFENVVVDASRTGLSECWSCSCELSLGERTCCTGNGTCDAEYEPDAVQCTCEDGFFSPDCDKLETGQVTVNTQGCSQGDPTCQVKNPTYVFEYTKFDGETFCPEADLLPPVEIVVFYPDDLPNAAEGSFPAVTFVHGRGQVYDEYEPILGHLANNSMAVGSIFGTFGGNEVQRANLLFCLLRYMRNDWDFADKLSAKTVFMGHSTGAKAAAWAAKTVDEYVDPLPPPVVQAVVALAPGFGDSEVDASLDGSHAPAYMLMGASRDPDTVGNSVFWYDRAAAEGSPHEDALTKSLIWVVGADHNSFGGGSTLINRDRLFGVPEHQEIAKGYFAGFLNWHLFGELEHRQFFLGATIPPAITALQTDAGDPITLITAYREGPTTSAEPIVIDHMERTPGVISPSTIGGVVLSNALQALAHAVGEDLDPHPAFPGGSDSQYHDTAALTATGGVMGSSLLFTVPAANQDLSDTTVLSFRVAHETTRGLVCAPDPNLDASVFFRFSDSDGALSDPIDVGTLTTYGSAAVPDHYNGNYCPAGACNFPDSDCPSVTVMGSVRLPLVDVCDDVDVTKVDTIEFLFAQGETFLIDSVEFTRSTLDGDLNQCPNVCGNGSLENGEACDGVDLGGMDCTDLAFEGGLLTCSDECEFETLGCHKCGNGAIDPGEQCDGVNLGLQTCVSLNFGGGILECTAGCSFDTSLCTSDLPGCAGDPGDPGCECLPVDPLLGIGIDGGDPDGPGSYDLVPVTADLGQNPGMYCPDSESSTGLAVWGLTFVLDLATPVCVECAVPGNGTQESEYGCPCLADSDCAATGVSGPVSGDSDGTSIKLTCWGDADGGWDGDGGRCLPRVNEVNPNAEPHPEEPAVLTSELEEFERTKWICKIPCGDLDVTGSAAHHCSFNLNPVQFDVASCAEQTCARDPGEVCADSGGHCGPFATCQNECNPGNNTGAGNPDCLAYGYPQVWECTTWLNRPRCAPPECRLDPGGGGPGDRTLCDQLIYGNLIPM